MRGSGISGEGKERKNFGVSMSYYNNATKRTEALFISPGQRASSSAAVNSLIGLPPGCGVAASGVGEK
jgi:hypothetical protein